MSRQCGNFGVFGRKIRRPGRLPLILALLALAGLLSAGVARAVPATLLWQDLSGTLGGDNNLATGVAALGSKVYVAFSFSDASHVWWGQVRIYDAKKGSILWSSDIFNLNGGRTAGIAVAGSSAYVAGYYGVAGSGNEEVFLRTYDASGKKGLKGESHTGAPMAGLYPTGVKALGSKVVAFSNSESSPGVVRGSIAGFSSKTGAYIWGADYGESWQNLLSSKVNDIAVSGSSVAVAGYQQTSDGYKWFNVSQYSAVNGSYVTGNGSRGSTYSVENEALAVSWTGSVIGAAGYRTDDFGNSYAHAARIIAKGKGAGMTTLEDFDLGYGDQRFNAVVVTKSRIYVAGYGLASLTEQPALTRSYDPKSGKLVDYTMYELSALGGMVTTGIAAGKSGIYVAGSGLESPGVTDWFVKGFNTNLSERWLQDLNAFDQDTNKALGVTASSSAIVAVGQVKDTDGKMRAAVQAYGP